MSSERMLEILARGIRRRTFLVRVGTGAVGLALGMLGQTKMAAGTFVYACCTLCFVPDANCGLNCTTCAWCWLCNNAGTWWSCCECHSTNDGCGVGDCVGVYCSYAQRSGFAPVRAKVAGRDLPGPAASA